MQKKLGLVQNFNVTRGFTQLGRDFICLFNISNKKISLFRKFMHASILHCLVSFDKACTWADL